MRINGFLNQLHNILRILSVCSISCNMIWCEVCGWRPLTQGVCNIVRHINPHWPCRVNTKCFLCTHGRPEKVQFLQKRFGCKLLHVYEGPNREPFLPKSNIAKNVGVHQHRQSTWMQGLVHILRLPVCHMESCVQVGCLQAARELSEYPSCRNSPSGNVGCGLMYRWYNIIFIFMILLWWQ